MSAPAPLQLHAQRGRGHGLVLIPTKVVDLKHRDDPADPCIATLMRFLTTLCRARFWEIGKNHSVTCPGSPAAAHLVCKLCLPVATRSALTWLSAGRTLLEVLQDFPSAAPPLMWLLQAGPRLQPRRFSIASSLRAHPDEAGSAARPCLCRFTLLRSSSCSPKPFSCSAMAKLHALRLTRTVLNTLAYL